MKKNYMLTFLLGLFISSASAQFTVDDIKFWVGSGPDTSVLVVDFRDGSQDTSYAWGFLYNEANNVTFRNMLEAVSAAEPKFVIDVASSGFLNSVTYNSHSGLVGNPDYWSTWSGDDAESMIMNSGISEVLANGRWMGLSYGFTPNPVHPGTPWPAYSSQWFSKEDVEFWVGSGADSAVLVLDFVGELYGPAPTYAFGVKFDGSITGKQMLQLVDAADQNLSVDLNTYLNDIIYNDLEGIAGDPEYWSTFSGTNMSDWVFNDGITATVSNGGWFGCTYAPWPARRPFIPIPANDPNAVTIDDVASWVGTGADSAVIVIDFNDGGNPESFVFGYLFNGTATGKDALIALDTSLTNLDIAISTSGYLNDITYFAHTGIGGTNGNYWSTWSGMNNGNWIMNSGINSSLTNGSWFGCSFNDFDPALPPGTPAIAPNTASLAENTANQYAVYPNPVQDVLHIQGSAGNLTIADVTGKVVYSGKHIGFSKIDMSSLNAGMYLVSVEANGQVSTKTVIK